MKALFLYVILFASASALAGKIKILDIPAPREAYVFVEKSFQADIHSSNVSIDIDLVKYRSMPPTSVPRTSHYLVSVPELIISNGKLILVLDDGEVECGDFKEISFMGTQVWNLNGNCVFEETRAFTNEGERFQIYLKSVSQ